MPVWLRNFLTSAVLKSWQTTLVGALVAAYIVIKPFLESGQWPDKQHWLIALAVFIGGLISKSHNAGDTINVDHGAS